MKAIYKCRVCGEKLLVPHDEIESEYVAEKEMWRIMDGEKTKTSPWVVHTPFDDDHLGIADFIGWEVES